MGPSNGKQALEQVHTEVRSCRLCPLWRSRTKAVPGEGAVDARIMFVGEAPGLDEDRQGRPFVGAAGRVLNEQLRKVGIDRPQVFITNVVKCRPEGNRDPEGAEIEACRDHLLTQIAIINPKVICTLGRFAARTLIDSGISISREHGKARRISGILYLPIYHPAAALHQARLIDSLESDFRRLKSVLEQELGTAASPQAAGDA